VGENAQLAVDVTSGNIYVTSGSSILVFDQYDNTNVVKYIPDFTGTLGKIELLSEIGYATADSSILLTLSPLNEIMDHLHTALWTIPYF